MSIIKKLALSLAGMVGLGSMVGSQPRPMELKSKVKFTTAPSECSEAEHERS